MCTTLFAELDEETTDSILKIFQNRSNSDKKVVTIVMKTFQRQWIVDYSPLQ